MRINFANNPEDLRQAPYGENKSPTLTLTPGSAIQSIRSSIINTRFCKYRPSLGSL